MPVRCLFFILAIVNEALLWAVVTEARRGTPRHSSAVQYVIPLARRKTPPEVSYQVASGSQTPTPTRVRRAPVWSLTSF